MVDQLVLAVLAIMSVGSWYIMIVRVWDTHKLGNEAREVRTAFFKKASLSDGLRGLKEESAFRYIAATAIEASEHHEGALTENIDHSSWVTMNAERAVAEVNGKLGSGPGLPGDRRFHQPFIGLMGTRVGILQALTAIGVAGQLRLTRSLAPWRCADHDLHRSGRRCACRAGLQLAAQPQQGCDGPSACLCR